MKPIKTILTATDFSPTAGRAEERAALLAASCDVLVVPPALEIKT